MKKYFLSVVLLLCSALSSWAQFSGEGSGTKSDPYRITNAIHLDQMRNVVGAYYQLENDIDVSSWIRENSPSKGWQPIGVSSSPFGGTFDGQGHTIRGITINRSESEYVGFFGYTQGATIKNLNIEATVAGGNNTGGLIGYDESSSISDIKVRATIIGGYNTGGIVGSGYSSVSLSNCRFVGDVTGENCSGGISGYISGEMSNCAVIGNINGKNSCTGGMTGEAKNADIRDNIFSGSVKGIKNVGGVVGYFSCNRQISYRHYTYLQRNISYATIEGETSIGGIVGYAEGNYYYSRYSSSYYDFATIYSNVALNITLKGTKTTAPRNIIGEYGGYVEIGANGGNNANRSLVNTKVYKRGDSNADVEVSITEDDYNGESKSLSTLRMNDYYKAWGFDFVEKWSIIEGKSFPYKQYQLAPPVLDKILESNFVRVTGSSQDGGTAYLYYNNKTTPVSTVISNNKFSFTTEPLIKGSLVKLYIDDGESTPSYMLQNIVEEGTTVLVSKITISPSNASIEVDKTQQLTANITPTNATEKNVEWKSSNAQIAKVSDSGLVTAVAQGTATITCTAADGSGKQATCTVVVTPKPVYVTSVTLNNSMLNLETGQTSTLVANITPANASNKNVTWSSDKTSVATVSDAGVVTAVGVGTATVTCAAADGSGKTATCIVTVTAPVIKVSQITLNSTSLNVEVGKTSTITASVLPNNATNKNVIWASYNNAIATVSNTGVVTAVALGKTMITCTAADGSGVTTSCEVSVIPKAVLVTGITLNTTTLSLETGQSNTLSATVVPTNATNKSVAWSSNNAGVAAVSNTGVVTATGVGTAVITCTATDGSGKTATCTITVKAPTVMVSQITLSNNFLSIEQGKTSTLAATVSPNNASNKAVTWSSNNTTVATVSNTGVVTAVALGTASVICSAADGSGITATCAVTVVPKTIPVTGINLNTTSLNLKLGQSGSLAATVAPTNATNKNVIWSSNNVAVATVSNTGVVTALGAGSAIITCTAADGSGITATCTVTVSQPSVLVEQIMLNNTALTLAAGTTSTLAATVLPTNASSKNVKWATSNDKVAIVNGNGVVSAKDAGTAYVYCTAIDGSGVSATCTVTVTGISETILVTDITLNSTTLSVEQGQTSMLIATVAPVNAANKTVSWSSSNSNVASVNNAGLVTAIAKGTTTVYCTATDGSGISTSCTVNVTESSVPNETRTIVLNGSNAWSTWAGNENLNTVAGLEAYVVTNVNTASGIVTVARQEVIKAGTPMLLHRTSNATTFTLPVLRSAVLSDMPSDLYVVATTAMNVSTMTGSGQTVYILVNDEFVRTRSGVISAGKCYLALTGTASARMNIMFMDDDLTPTIVKPLYVTDETERWSTLGGQRVDRPTRPGLYIMNGKKVVIK